ncbi:MAG: hypothetical protein MUO39_02575 [Steroidobacteraceae bacterium]|nr:hypothetical protein [Steroidobacteraceae bacterium]
MIERGQNRLRVVLPWLEPALGAAAIEGRACARVPAAEWLLARGRSNPVQDIPWREWLLAPVAARTDLLRRCPAGPAGRANSTGRPPEGTWACARPVHLATAIEHLRLAPEDVEVQAGESSALLEDINRHLEGRGLRLHAQAGWVDWQLECDEPIECGSVEPELAAGRSIRDLMPGGRDGARVRALMNEIQMLLHEHPVNQDRAGHGRPAINTLWLWGFGRFEETDEVSLPMLYTDDAWLSGIWRLNGMQSEPLDELAKGFDAGGGQVLVAGSRPPGDSLSGNGLIDALAQAERSCFAPALAALRSGIVSGVDLLLGGRAYAVERSARFKFWRRAHPLAGAPA